MFCSALSTQRTESQNDSWWYKVLALLTAFDGARIRHHFAINMHFTGERYIVSDGFLRVAYKHLKKR
jgi:hypothetical protein